MLIEAEHDECSLAALTLHLTSTKAKVRQDAFNRIKCIVDDAYLRSLSEDALQDVLLSVLTFAKIEGKASRGAAEAAQREKCRTASTAMKWALGLLDKAHPRIIALDAAKRLIGELVALCQSFSSYVDLLSSLNLYVLNKREYLLAIDGTTWNGLIDILAGLPRNSQAERKELAVALAHFNLITPSASFGQSASVLSRTLIDLLCESVQNASRTEEYAIMLAMKHLAWTVVRLRHTDSIAAAAICARVLQIVRTYTKRPLFVDQEILIFLELAARMASVEFMHLLGTVQQPNHLDLLDPLAVIDALLANRAEDPTLQYLVNYFRLLFIADSPPFPSLDELFRTRRVDFAFLGSLLGALHKERLDADYLQHLCDRMAHLDADVLCWHLALCSKFGISNLAQFVPFFYRPQTSRLVARILRRSYRADVVHAVLNQMFAIQSSLMSLEMVELIIVDFERQFLTAGNFLWTRRALGYYENMLAWLLQSVNKASLAEFPLSITRCLLLPFCTFSIQSDSKPSEWTILMNLLEDVNNPSSQYPILTLVENERLADFASLLGDFLATFGERSFEPKGIGPIVSKRDRFGEAPTQARQATIALVAAAIAGLDCDVHLSTLRAHSASYEKALFVPFLHRLPDRILILLAQSIVERLEADISDPQHDEFGEGLKSASQVDVSSPASFALVLPERDVHRQIGLLALFYEEIKGRSLLDEDLAFANDLGRYLEGQLLSSIPLVRSFSHLLDGGILTAFLERQLKSTAPADTAAQVHLLDLLAKHPEHGSAAKLLPSLSSFYQPAGKILDLMWGSDKAAALLASLSQSPMATRAFLHGKAITDDLFGRISAEISWQSQRALSAIQCRLHVLKRSPVDPLDALYQMITCLPLGKLGNLIGHLSLAISEFVLPYTPLHFLSAALQRWLRHGREPADFPSELFGIPIDMHEWSPEMIKALAPFLAQTGNLQCIAQHGCALPEVHSAALIHKVSIRSVPLDTRQMTSMIVCLAVEGHFELALAELKKRGLADFKPHLPSLLPLFLDGLLARYHPDPFRRLTALPQTACPLVFAIFCRAALRELGLLRPRFIQVLRVLSTLKIGVSPAFAHEQCVALAKAALKTEFREVAVEFFDLLHQKSLLSDACYYALKSVLLLRQYSGADPATLLSLLDECGLSDFIEMMGKVDAPSERAMLALALSRNLGRLKADALFEDRSRLIHAYVIENLRECAIEESRSKASLSEQSHFENCILAALYEVLRSPSSSLGLTFDSIAVACAVYSLAELTHLPAEIGDFFGSLKSCSMPFPEHSFATKDDFVTSQILAFNIPWIRRVSPELMQIPSVKRILHTHGLSRLAFTDADAFQLHFRELLNRDEPVGDIIRSVVSKIPVCQDGATQGRLRSLLSNHCGSILPCICPEDPHLALFCASILVEQGGFDPKSCACTPELAGLCGKGIELCLASHGEGVEESCARSAWLSQQWTLEELRDTVSWDATYYHIARQSKKLHTDLHLTVARVAGPYLEDGSRLAFMSRLAHGSAPVNSASFPVESIAANLRDELCSDIHDAINSFIRSKSNRLAIDAIVLLRTQATPNFGLLASLATAKYLWKQGRPDDAVDVCRKAASSLEGLNSHLQLAFLGRMVKWSYSTRSATTEDIVSSYARPLLRLLEDPLAGRAKHYLCLAKFFDAHYEHELNSQAFKHRQQICKHGEAEIGACQKLIARGGEREAAHHQRLLAHLSAQLAADKRELELQVSNRQAFLHQAVGCYLSTIRFASSLKHELAAFRLHSLWLANRSEQQVNAQVDESLRSLPLKCFIPLMYQLAACIDGDTSVFQRVLGRLVYQLVRQHLPQTIYQLLALNKANATDKKRRPDDERRAKAAQALIDKLRHEEGAVNSIEQLCAALIELSHMPILQELAQQAQASKKIIAISPKMLIKRLSNLASIPLPTVDHPLGGAVVCLHSFVGDGFRIVGGMNLPKIIEAVGTDGRTYRMLVKGHDDVRQDAVVEQVLVQVRRMLASVSSDLTLRTYRVVPLAPHAGVLEWVQSTVPMGEYIVPAHDAIYPDDLSVRETRHLMKREHERTASTPATKMSVMRDISACFRPVMRHFFFDRFHAPASWYAARKEYTSTTAAASILGWILGLGDRHSHNILLDTSNGQAIHIDLNMIFEQGLALRIPERVPFRLTLNVVDGLLGVFDGRTATDQDLLNGPFGRGCQDVLGLLRRQAAILMTILEVFRHDPLYRWSVSPLKLAKQLPDHASIQFANFVDWGHGQQQHNNASSISSTADAEYNRDAERALARVREKLGGYLSVRAQIASLVSDARNIELLSQMYTGWMAWV